MLQLQPDHNVLIRMRLFLIFLIFVAHTGHGQTVCTPESRDRLDEYLLKLSEMDPSQKPINQVTVEIGQWFLNTPYVEKTLELPGEEKLVINLTGLDCTTYLETVVTLSRLAKLGQFSFTDYEQELSLLRYEEGSSMDYPSRLHYFSDWIYQNQEKGILEDITKEIGGKVYANDPSFMTANPRFYAQLANPEYVKKLKQSEAAISKRAYHYIPKEEIAKHEQKIQSGDLIAITTPMQNLDIVHVGFAVKKNGRIHLMHASTGSMKVEISEKPLSDYLMGNKSQSGIMVARLTSP
ncbi:N-acetylmuramoyl-L-alanine amidase-like domain-containing protein [Pararhodonellum marinum]|uniref:N-acetylmuramoyl-L-alanine amidase-like domain-containing protein n=1 Tax=Pararhodonellum marinum TaxID=2755358 RepID=UPI001E317780|nr:N-acetylmuramoyl-L-alanine amidase-like domain-containing protein [Pararhodonellum marinum]